MSMNLAIAVASALTFGFGTHKIMKRVKWKRLADQVASNDGVPHGWWYVDVDANEPSITVLDGSDSVQWSKGQELVGDDLKELVRRAKVGTCGYKRITIPISAPAASSAVPAQTSETVSTRYSYAVLRSKSGGNVVRIVGIV